MATAQQLMPPSAISNLTVPSRDTLKIDGIGDDQFPAGLRVLVVDDDPICLLILDRLLRQCRYEVTTCGKATTALKMLRENRSKFDLVISDVVMPDMDGFKLLELVGLEMDLPVIMMSANGETSAVMKGITHGACDYLLKPVRIEELKNIWQHVVRKKKRDSELSPACRDEKLKRELEDGDRVSSMNDCLEGAARLSKKRKDIKEEAEDVEQDNEDGLSTRKPRVVWSVELHQQFVAAVNQLGIDKAVPKRILELMNVPNLTRENIASHLQKYRLYLKRISGVTQQPGGLNASFLGGSDPSFCAGSGGHGDFHTFAATGQLVPHSLMLTSQLGLLGQLGTSSNMSMVGADPSLLLKLATLQGASNNQLGMLHYDASVLGGSQRNLPQAFSSGPDLKPLAQGALPLSAFPQLGEPVEKGQIEISTIQPPTAGAGLNCGQKRTGVNSNSSFHPSKNNALMMQMLQPQRQPSAQLTSADMLCLPSVELLGQHMLSNDLTNTKFTVPPSTVIGPSVKNENAMNIQSAGEVTVGSGSLLSGASSYSPSTLNMLGRTLGADTTALHLNEETRNVSPSLPAGFGRELDATGIKVLDSASIGIIQTPSMMGSDLSSFMESKNGSHNTHGWQRLKVGQDMGQTLTPIISPRYTQSMSCGPGLNRTRQQEEGQGQRHSIDENMIVSVLGGRPLKPSMSNFPPLREHSMASMEPKMKNTSSNLLVQSKEELGFLSEPFSSSDELLNLIFKQQRGSGFMEADLSAGNFSDGYEIKSS